MNSTTKAMRPARPMRLVQQPTNSTAAAQINKTACFMKNWACQCGGARMKLSWVTHIKGARVFVCLCISILWRALRNVCVCTRPLDKLTCRAKGRSLVAAQHSHKELSAIKTGGCREAYNTAVKAAVELQSGLARSRSHTRRQLLGINQEFGVQMQKGLFANCF